MLKSITALTTMQKCLAGLGAGIFAIVLFAYGIGAFHGSGNSNVPGNSPQSAPGSNSSLSQVAGQGSAPQSVASTSAAANFSLNKPLPANASSVPDEYLQQLAMVVNLAGAPTQPPDKNLWTEALPVAEKLNQGPCDCEQKIWLTHFIEMGNDALSGSVDQYHETARLLVTLGRNDEQAMALSKKPAQR